MVRTMLVWLLASLLAATRLVAAAGAVPLRGSLTSIG